MIFIAYLSAISLLFMTACCSFIWLLFYLRFFVEAIFCLWEDSVYVACTFGLVAVDLRCCYRVVDVMRPLSGTSSFVK